MEVTVTARNCVPHEGSAHIYNPSGLEAERQATSDRRQALSIIPNPSRASFTIAAPGCRHIAVYTTEGRMVWQTTSDGSLLTTPWSLCLPAGVYIVRAGSRVPGPGSRYLPCSLPKALISTSTPAGRSSFISASTV